MTRKTKKKIIETHKESRIMSQEVTENHDEVYKKSQKSYNYDSRKKSGDFYTIITIIRQITSQGMTKNHNKSLRTKRYYENFKIIVRRPTIITRNYEKSRISISSQGNLRNHNRIYKNDTRSHTIITRYHTKNHAESC